MTAYQQTALYTRTNGYLKEWHFDIGQHVEKGQLMAVIETPEVDAQLEQSKATLEQNKANVVKAQADLDLARVTLQRYVDAQKTSPGSVTQEDVDTRRSAYDNAQAAVKQVQASVTQAQANVQQLQVTVNFEKIYAPFSGTVTARNYDVGALLSPTDIGPGKEIFDLAQTDKLRVFVNVPQTYASNVKRGQKAQLEVVNYPGRKFDGTITLTAGAIDPNTRTLRTQIDFDNADGSLFAGAYGQLFLPVTPQQAVSVIPSSSLVFNAAGTEVATLGPDDKVHVRTVELGRDLGTELEVTKGLDAADRVIVNPGERTTEGAEVDATEAPKDTSPRPQAGRAPETPAQPPAEPTAAPPRARGPVSTGGPEPTGSGRRHSTAPRRTRRDRVGHVHAAAGEPDDAVVTVDQPQGRPPCSIVGPEHGRGVHAGPVRAQLQVQPRSQPQHEHGQLAGPLARRQPFDVGRRQPAARPRPPPTRPGAAGSATATRPRATPPTVPGPGSSRPSSSSGCAGTPRPARAKLLTSYAVYPAAARRSRVSCSISSSSSSAAAVNCPSRLRTARAVFGSYVSA